MIFADSEAAADALQELNERGQLPELVGRTADDRPVWLWLDEFGGDEVFLRVCVLLLADGGAESMPQVVRSDTIAWPVRTGEESEYETHDEVYAHFPDPRRTVPGYEGSVGPGKISPGPHVYARDPQSGAGNCVCGGQIGHRLHTEVAPGYPIRRADRS